MLLSVVLSSVATACGWGRETERVSDLVRFDSAGVEVVVNSRTAAEVPVFATLDGAPSLRLGSVDGRPEEQFGAVTDVLPLGDGGVAVLDGQAAQILLFDGDGGYRSTLGFKGDGPAGFQSPIRIGLLPGDTLAVYDSGPRRITRFAPSGELGRITTLRETTARIVAASFLPGGGMVGQSRWLDPAGGTLPGPEWTLVRDTAVLTAFSTMGTVQDTVDLVAGRETLTSIVRTASSISVFRRSPVFGRTNVFAVAPNGIWSSSNDRFELRLYDVSSGRLIRIVRAPELERPATDELAEAIYDRAYAEAGTPEDRRRTDAWFALSPRPDRQPAFDLLVVDDHTRLWVHEWSALAHGNRWWVFSPDGELLGSVEVPSGMTITAVRCGWIWGIEQDELDVSYVVRYEAAGLDGC